VHFATGKRGRSKFTRLKVKADIYYFNVAGDNYPVKGIKRIRKVVIHSEDEEIQRWYPIGGGRIVSRCIDHTAHHYFGLKLDYIEPMDDGFKPMCSCEIECLHRMVYRASYTE
jgi:hypothetical protein